MKAVLKAVLTLDEKEITEAVKNFVIGNGYNVTDVTLAVISETDNDRFPERTRTTSSIKAVVSVGPNNSQR